MQKIKPLIGRLAVGCIIALCLTSKLDAQTNLQFTGVNATPEKAIQLHWASNTNELYQIQYANALATNADGSTAWFTLVDDYPAQQGTNTLWLDTGDYNLSPVVPRPKDSPMRFYRVMLEGTNTSGDNPTVAITYPTGDATLSGSVTVTVSASSDQVLENVALYVDGQEMWPSDDGTNFVINTCEWWNGQHTLFAVAKSASHLPGIPNDTGVTYGHAVSPYVNVTFSNLISEVQFSQPYFEPSLGETQEVTANFAANCDWTLQIQDVNGNTVRNASGSGNSLLFDWDGTGDGETNIPDGVYTFFISAETNGEADEVVGGGSGGSGGGSPPSPDFAFSDSPELWAMSADGNDAVPLAIYPPGFDTNDLTIFSATPSEIQAARSPSIRTASFETEDASPAYSGPSSQDTSAPTRSPNIKGKGTVGTFLVGYQVYFTAPYATFSTPPIPTGYYPLSPRYVQLDEENSSQAGNSETWGGNLFEAADVGNGFATAMKKGRWQGSVNGNITGSDVTGGYFNQVNVGLLVCHGSYGTTMESDGVIHSYLRFYKNGSPSYARLDDCSFGSSGTNSLKWMGIL
ncbi:MAG: Ig-like domain-containing protein, partial [Limisphaerales bacterium]